MTLVRFDKFFHSQTSQSTFQWVLFPPERKLLGFLSKPVLVTSFASSSFECSLRCAVPEAFEQQPFLLLHRVCEHFGNPFCRELVAEGLYWIRYYRGSAEGFHWVWQQWFFCQLPRGYQPAWFSLKDWHQLRWFISVPSLHKTSALL